MSEIFQVKSKSQIVDVEPTQTLPINSLNFPPLLIQGGVAIAVIIALTYYNQVLLKLVTKIILTNKKGR